MLTASSPSGLGLLYKLKRLVTLKAVPGWAIVVWEVVDHFSRVEFVFTWGWRGLKGVLDFLASHPGTRLLVGITWLTLTLLLPRNLFSRSQRQPWADRQLLPEPLDLGKDKSRKDCPDTWLHTIAEAETESLQRVVSISSQGMLPKDFGGTAPYINFNFMIHNCSVFPITLDFVDGYVKCITAPLGKRTEVNE